MNQIKCSSCGGETIKGDIISACGFGEYFVSLEESKKSQKQSPKIKNKIYTYVCKNCGLVIKHLEEV